MTTTAPILDHAALAIRVRGVVQGVGFRPFVHRLAITHDLSGWVRNEAEGVYLLVQGRRAALDAFVRAIERQAPPITKIDLIETDEVELEDTSAFRILDSHDRSDRRQPVAPDVALCARCETELLDPSDRRFHYPFITCTDCGPRFSVIDAMPYDRERTSMRTFAQCAECDTEYRTPADRRYHSESNSCRACGPRLWFERSAGNDGALDGTAGLEIAAGLLVQGGILAIRGLGGFHLAVDATNDQAVTRLRTRKGREAKPLAVMVRTVSDAEQLGIVGPEEKRLLTSAERPIVLLDARPGSPVAPSVAPRVGTVGVVTAYTPLHHLLLARVDRPLVMTSGNLSEEPIATGIDEARTKLHHVADAFLLHDREITARCDDSVVRLVDGDPILLRRARGYAPLPLRLPIPTPQPLVAVGPHLKNTFTLAIGDYAYVSQHIGDLENLATLDHFRATLDAYARLFRIEPTACARDTHPGYLSSRIAEDMGLEPMVTVQHHHAHVAAVAAEYGVTDPVIGVAYDGTGYGDDGAVWGAEILVADLTSYERVGQLRYAPLPGGDLAARQPWRSAMGYLPCDRAGFPEVDETEYRTVRQQLERKVNAPLASSMGRLFDAAAAILGVSSVSRYEGEAAMMLENIAGARAASPLLFPIVDGDADRWMLDPVPLLVALRDRRSAGDDVATLAARFHESVAQATAALVARVGEKTGLGTVALCGGVFQNRRLLSSTRALLEEERFRVLIPRMLSPNDGAISYGQAAVAAARLAGTG